MAVYYLVLDVKESDCSVLSRKRWDDCEPALSKRVPEIVSKQGTLLLLLSFLTLTSVYSAYAGWLLAWWLTQRKRKSRFCLLTHEDFVDLEE